MEHVKTYLSGLKTFLIKNKHVFILAVPFLLIDIFMRIVGRDINYFRAAMVLPNILFNVIWIGLFLGIALNLKGNLGKVVYWGAFLLYFVLFLVNSIYYSLTGFFFSFALTSMADEGSSYIVDTILNTSPIVYLMCLVILFVAILCARKFPKKEKSEYKNIMIVLVAFVVLHFVTPFCMGGANESLEWDNWRNPRNVYNNFNDTNKNMKICGIYEFAFRDFYMTYLKPDAKEDPEELAYLQEIYKNTDVNEPNAYTGIFEGKNIIFLQLEGLDSWLLNEKDTPTLYGMLNNSIVFNNHFSYYSGGGSTFNSELAVNTGLITPVTYNQNAYSFNRNRFDMSMAHLFKEQGYRVNAFHMNTQEYYSRGINYSNWGYDHYYGLMDENDYDDLSYELDRELIQDQKFYDRMFKQAGKFVHYIITYTPHTPFSTEKGMGKLLAEKVYEDEVPVLSEEECARMYAAETDLMVQMLLEALEKSDLLEDTVIVAFADHYLYTLNDKTILDQYKQTDNNLINQTPFFIWSKDMEKIVVDKVNSQIDILPTVLNLFGMEYIPEYYIGRDIFDSEYKGYVFFSDYSWYDGNVYVEDGVVTNGNAISEEELHNMNEHINNLILKNDLTLKYDYFRRIGK